MSLSPWDLSGISFDFSLYRPRRASYLYATQISRRRNESYRSATTSDATGENGFDFIERMAAKKRKASYRKAVGHDIEAGESAQNRVDGPSRLPRVKVIVSDEDGRQATLDEEEMGGGHFDEVESTGSPAPSVELEVGAEAADEVFQGGYRGTETDIDQETQPPEEDEEDPVEIIQSRWKCRRNLVVLTISFILVFTAFRSIQNLQSSLNTSGKLGVIAMGCVHATMFLTCLFAPVLINKLTAKWTIVLGLLFYLFWIAANFYPHFYTLIPTSIGVGFGQSLAWGAQVTYINKMAADYAHLSKEVTQHELYKFNGVFLAFFQTSHIWGNLVSSLMLSNHGPVTNDIEEPVGIPEGMEGMEGMDMGMVEPGMEMGGAVAQCGVYESCRDPIPLLLNMTQSGVSSASNGVLKLMGSYLVFAFTGFVMALLFLERIGAKSDPDKSCLQMVWNNMKQLTHHSTYRLLIPLLIFNGFEQGFVYADYNKSYITCTVGVEYVGYNMIMLGLTTSVFSVLVGMAARRIPREAILGLAAILHLGLLVFLLVWIPDKKLPVVFFIISALWGICDAMWQTQCNSLVNVSCPEDHKTAFQNFRMLQGLGASLAFILGAIVCVGVKLYIIISLLITAVLFYVVAEYRLRNQPANRGAVVTVTVQVRD